MLFIISTSRPVIEAAAGDLKASIESNWWIGLCQTPDSRMSTTKYRSRDPGDLQLLSETFVVKCNPHFVSIHCLSLFMDIFCLGLNHGSLSNFLYYSWHLDIETKFKEFGLV